MRPAVIALLLVTAMAQANWVIERSHVEPPPQWTPNLMIRWFEREADHQRRADSCRKRIAGIRNRASVLLDRTPWLWTASEAIFASSLAATRWYTLRADGALHFRYDLVPLQTTPATGVGDAEILLDSAELTLDGVEFAISGRTPPAATPVSYLDVRPKPVLIEVPRAAYAQSAEAAHLRGVARVAILVGADGLIADARIIESSGHGSLDSAALAAARLVRCRPGKRLGVPVPVWTDLEYRFPPESGRRL